MLTLWITCALAGEKIRGVTVSTPTFGQEWGSDEMASTLDVLGELGVNWVAIHPYAGIGGDGTVRHRGLDPEDPPEWLVRPIREAHARGQKVLVVPHLAHWGSPFSWRGAIAFEDEAEWSRFFATYSDWVVVLAKIASDADAFVVGSELDATLGHEAEWRRVIGEVRSVYRGPLTYGANWDAYERVPFWDAVDAVGIQAYFPLSLADDPEPVALASAWAAIGARLRAFHDRTGKPIVFTELGYDDGPQAAREPWANGRGDTTLQRECLLASLRALDELPFVVGAFLWKWFPGETGGGDYELSRSDLREVIARSWGPRG